MLIAMRFQEPIVLIATGKGLTWPLTVGFSIKRAFPPAGAFISRSASSVISSSVATGSRMRTSSPALVERLNEIGERREGHLRVTERDRPMAALGPGAMAGYATRHTTRCELPAGSASRRAVVGSKPFNNVRESRFIEP